MPAPKQKEAAAATLTLRKVVFFMFISPKARSELNCPISGTSGLQKPHARHGSPGTIHVGVLRVGNHHLVRHRPQLPQRLRVHFLMLRLLFTCFPSRGRMMGNGRLRQPLSHDWLNPGNPSARHPRRERARCKGGGSTWSYTELLLPVPPLRQRHAGATMVMARRSRWHATGIASTVPKRRKP